MIGIVDYGVGNLRSVKKAFDFLEMDNQIISSAEEFSGINRLVLPGVGSFGYAVGKICQRGLYYPVKDWLQAGKPFLGICLGLQLLFESSEESPGLKGFSLFQGQCCRFQAQKVPQIGWNDIQIQKENPLFQGIKDREFFYFVHGYYVLPEEKRNILALTQYGQEYTSAAAQGRVCGVQFHPEKSGAAGLKVLSNWGKLC
ncbi:imidazole glycerol phosphate synthase subunit HisH [bacterium]|nr:imidazole glycerol phosphate synthase subunit HisH [bacterium]